MAGYWLGVDLGTTWTAAAIAGDGDATVVSLSQRSPAIPTVVHVGPDGNVLVGDAAIRRAIDEPERVAREMKRRIGDAAPILLGGSPWSPELLQARVLRWVVERVTEEQGRAPMGITVTHPANWGQFKLDLLAQAIRQVGLDEVALLPEPVAAASWYASDHRLADGESVAVYDLGGGTFDTAVVRRTGGGFELLGRPDGVERLGGIDFDAAVLDHVVAQVGADLGALDPADPEVRADVAELRSRCVEAKEALSADTVVSVPVRLPSIRTTVRLTREELEARIRVPLAETTTALRRTLASAGVAASDLRAVLLVGGSSRIPLVSQLVASDVGVPVAVDANPKFAVALGAALVAAGAAPAAAVAPAAPAAVVAAPPVAEPEPPAAVAPAAPAEPPAAPPPPAGADRDEPEPEPDEGARRRPRWLPVAAVVIALAVLGTAVALTRGGDDGGEEADGTTEEEPSDEEGDDGSDGASEFADGDFVLHIGLLLPSGDLEHLAPAMQAAAQLAVDDLNDAGGVLGSPVELLIEDSGGGGGEGVHAAFDALVAADADLMVGPVDAAGIAVAKELAAEQGIAGCSAHDTRIDSLFDDDGRWVRTIPSEELFAAAITRAITDDGYNTVNMVTPPEAADLRDALVGHLEDAGVTVDKNREIDPSSFDPAEVVSDLNDSGALAAILVGAEEYDQIIVAGSSTGMLGPFYGDELMEAPEVGRRVSDAIAGGAQLFPVSPVAAPHDGDPEGVAARVAARLGDGLPAYSAPYVYDCVMLAGVTAEMAGSDHPDALAESMIEASGSGESCFTTECLPLAVDGTDFDFEGESGSLDFDSDGEVTVGLFDRWSWTAGADAPDYVAEIEVEV